MSKLINALSRIGLLEYEQGAPEELLGKAEAETKTVTTDKPDKGAGSVKATNPARGAERVKAAEPAESKQPGAGDTPTRTLDQIYAAAKVPESVYPAERFLKLIDGLKALDIPTRKAAVLAIDAADDTWNVDNPVRDADAKTKALRTEQERLAAVATAADARAAAALAAEEQKQVKFTQTIRQEIAELELRLQAELESSALNKAMIDAAAREERRVCESEVARLADEITRLSQVHAFAPESEDRAREPPPQS